MILGFLSSSQRWHARWCAACGAAATRYRPVPFARFASLYAVRCSAVSVRGRTGVLASSFTLEAGGFDSPLAYPSGLDRPAHCAASVTFLVRAATLERTPPSPSLPH